MKKVNKLNCLICNKEIYLKTKKLCFECSEKELKRKQKEYRIKNKKKYNKYMCEYMQFKRWFEGGVDNFFLGEHKKVTLRSVNGVLRI